LDTHSEQNQGTEVDPLYLIIMAPALHSSACKEDEEEADGIRKAAVQERGNESRGTVWEEQKYKEEENKSISKRRMLMSKKKRREMNSIW